MQKKSVLILLLFSFSPLLGLSQEADTTVINLDDVVIAENRIQLPYAKQNRSISILDRTKIANTPAISVPDLLHHVSGVDVRTRGVNGVQADIGIRGGTFDQTLILVNGIKISDPQTGHHSMNLPVDLGNIERIEVLKGPGARTFGQNAFSGAINVVTATPTKSYLKVGAIGGDFALWGLSASGAVVSGEQSHYMSVNYDQSDGYKHNTDYKIFNAFYNSSIKLGQGKLSFLGGYTDRSFGANGFYASPAFTEQYESIQTGLAALSYKTRIGKSNFEARTYYRQNDDEYLFIRADPEFFKNNHTSRTLGLELNTVIPFENSTTGLGIDINKVTLRSNNLGDRDRTVASMFIEHRMEFFEKKISLTPGIQLNYYSDFGLNALPGIDLGYQINKNLSVFSSIGYTYRVPTFTDLYYTDPLNIGNPDLLPEYAWNYELGFKTSSSSLLAAQVSLFYRDGNNMIDWVRQSETDPWQPINVLSLTMAGLDTDLTFNLNTLGSMTNPIFNQAILNYTYINAIADNPTGEQSRYALENLRHQFRFTLNLSYGPKVSHTMSIGYYDRVNLTDYSVTDTRISYRAKRYNLFVDITNIFDVSYQETNLVTMPGRWLKLGVNVSVF